MSIWFHKELSFDQLTRYGSDTMMHFLDIKWSELGDDFIKATMPVAARTKQPYGLLHGGASCVLAETLGSYASSLVIDPDKFQCVGIEINANHVHSATSGLVTGVASPLHLGKATHVWDVKIYNEAEKLICVCRLTVVIIKKRDFSKPQSL